jgi:hypothetical protein
MIECKMKEMYEQNNGCTCDNQYHFPFSAVDVATDAVLNVNWQDRNRTIVCPRDSNCSGIEPGPYGWKTYLTCSE